MAKLEHFFFPYFCIYALVSTSNRQKAKQTKKCGATEIYRKWASEAWFITLISYDDAHFQRRFQC